MNPRIGAREVASPKGWAKTQSEMVWHHIIPFWVLREVWNRLVDQHIATELAEARVAIRQYLVLADRNLMNLNALIDRIRAENVRLRRSANRPLLPLDVSEAHLLATAAMWPSWNVVEGPRRRSDDPKGRYFDRFTSGLTGEEMARMRMIETLFPSLQAFIGAGMAPDAVSLRTLTLALTMARSTVWCDSPIRFRDQMWVKDATGMWRKRRDGEPYIGQ